MKVWAQAVGLTLLIALTAGLSALVIYLLLQWWVPAGVAGFMALVVVEVLLTKDRLTRRVP